MNLEKGGRGAIERMVEAYGFKTRQALCDHLGISKSTLATRYMRDSFPAEWVIQCALETDVSLKWLTDGQGIKNSSHNANISLLEKQVLIDGTLEIEGFYAFDSALLPDSIKAPMLVLDEGKTYIVEKSFDEVSDGTWLVKIEGKISVRELIRIPVGKVRVTSSNTNITFDCALEELKPVAKCHYYLMTAL